jgi:hypothetical protein
MGEAGSMVERVGSDLHVRETIGRRRPSRKRWKRRERERDGAEDVQLLIATVLCGC